MAEKLTRKDVVLRGAFTICFANAACAAIYGHVVMHGKRTLGYVEKSGVRRGAWRARKITGDWLPVHTTQTAAIAALLDEVNRDG